MHYLTAVITENKPDDDILAKMLAPYDQGLEVEPYITDGYAEVKKTMKHDADGLPDDEREELLEALEKDDIGTIRYYNLKHDFMYYEDINRNGEGLSSHNPDSKWDSWHVLEKNKSFLGIDQLAQLKDIPRLTEPLLHEKFKDMAKLYGEQIAWDKVFRPGYADDHYPSLYDYICYRLPYDVIYPDGTWHEHDRRDLARNREYAKTFYATLDSFPQDYYLTLVDCHI